MVVNSSSISAQKEDYNWLFGYDYNVETEEFHGSVLGFDENKMLYYTTRLGGPMGSYISSISDVNGDLVLYTNGCSIFNASHQKVVNGEGLNLGNVYETHCSNGYSYTGVGDVLILRDPLEEHAYYVIHKTHQLISEPFVDVITPQIHYTYVDMSLNNGQGEVIEKNVVLFEDQKSVGGYLNACKHSNGSDWWIVQPLDSSYSYAVFLLNEDGINLSGINDEGPYFDGQAELSQSVFSPDGTKFLLFNYREGLVVHDFDRTTGLISNMLQIPILEDVRVTGIAISPNSRFAYLSAVVEVFQVDLLAENIAESKVKVGEWDGFEDPSPATFHLAMLGPDCRIYISTPSANKYLHIIHNPNEMGLNCNLIQRDVELPRNKSLYSMPNYPHYRMGDESVCNPFITGVQKFANIDDNYLKIFPNPTSGIVTVRSTRIDKIKIINLLGNVVLTETNVGTEQVQLDISHLNSGLYFLHVLNQNSERYEVRSFIKQ